MPDYRLPTRHRIPETLQDAKALIEEPDEAYDLNAELYDGKHFQNGAAFASVLAGLKGADKTAARKRLQASFLSQNVVQEVVNRKRDAVVGLEPRITVDRVANAPERREGEDEAEDEALEAVRAAFANWWEDADGLDATAAALVYAFLGGDGYLRAFIFDPDPVEEEGAPEEGAAPEEDAERQGQREDPPNLVEALRLFALAAYGPGRAGRFVDSRSGRPFSVLLYRADDEERAEVCFVNDEDQLVVRVYDADGYETYDGLDSAGRLTMQRLGTDVLVTQQVREQQHALNRALTLGEINVEHAGFRDRNFINVLPPGKWVDDATAPGGRSYEREETTEVGSNVERFFTGVPDEDRDGRVSYKTGSLVVVDPVPDDLFTGRVSAAKRNIYEETRQRHVMITGDAVATGESRRQAMAEFAGSLADPVREVETALTNLLNAVLRMAGDWGGESMADFRVSVKARVYIGPVTQAEIESMSQRYKDGVLSRVTYLAESGADNPEQELGRVEAEQAADPTRLGQLATVVKTLTDAGAGYVEALRQVGWPEDLIPEEEEEEPGGGPGGQ